MTGKGVHNYLYWKFMTIQTVRIYIDYENGDVTRTMAVSHWGVVGWLDKKLKTIKPELNGTEVKGVDVVNVCFGEQPDSYLHVDEWWRRANTFTYNTIYDIGSLIDLPPIENIEKLIGLSVKFMLDSPWPQTRAIGRLLSAPLTLSDKAEIQKYLDKHRLMCGG